jgi:hypothetical protein
MKPIPRQKNIRATVFGGKADKLRPERSAYDGKVLGDGLYAALPYRFKGKPPFIRLINPRDGRSAVVPIRDVGPWGTRDPYWLKGTRPEAESGRMKHGPNKGRRTNKAGIDLSVDAAKVIGITGDPKTDIIDWEFV